MERISTCRRYLIDVHGLDLLALGELRRGGSAFASSVLLNVLG